MYRVGILEVWRRNVLVEAETKSAAVEAVLSSKVPAVQESLTYLRILDPREWMAESTEPEEILAEALGLVGALCSIIQMSGGDKREALERAKAWENRFLAFAQDAQEADEQPSRVQGNEEGDDEAAAGGDAILGDSGLPKQAGIWDLSG